MKDYLERDLNVGDWMVLPYKGSSSVYLKLCRITGFSPKGRIFFVRYSKGYNCDISYTGRADECIKVSEDDVSPDAKIKIESLFQKEKAYYEEKERLGKLVSRHRPV